jgi:hypothetical protein
MSLDGQRREDPRSPYGATLAVDGHVERLIGSIRRECLDHLIVFDEAHLRRVLEDLRFVLQQSPDPSLIGQECAGLPPRSLQVGDISVVSILGGLHHQYVRV